MPAVTSTLITEGVKQGCLLSCKNAHLPEGARQAIQSGRAIAAHREKPVSEQHLLLVLSQDCDIDNPNDHYIEVLPVKKAPNKKVAIQQQENRNYRRLQLPISGGFWQLEAELISIIPKASIADADLKIEGMLDQRAKGIMVDWRVSRYNRVPFPDKFNQDFLIGYVKNLQYELGNFLKQHNKTILDLYIYVDPKDEEQAEEYRVSITALIDQKCSAELEKEIRDTLFRHCDTLHALPNNSLKMSQIGTSYAPKDFRITQDIVLRPSDFTLLDAMFLHRITLDYLCY